MVLRGVGQAVEEEIDAQQEETPGSIGILVDGRVLLLVLARVQGEGGDAGGDGRHDEVLVQRVALAEDGDVEQHDGEKLAALGEEEGDVVEVRERRVAERAGEAAGDGDEGERREDARRRDHGRHALPRGRRGHEVDAADCRSEERLNRVEEDGEVPYFRCVGRAVGRCRELLLEVRPSQAKEKKTVQHNDNLSNPHLLPILLLREETHKEA